MGINWFKYSSPQAFHPLAGRMIPWFSAAAIVLIGAGLYIGFFVAPTDFQQGDAYRIISSMCRLPGCPCFCTSSWPPGPASG